MHLTIYSKSHWAASTVPHPAPPTLGDTIQKAHGYSWLNFFHYRTLQSVITLSAKKLRLNWPMSGICLGWIISAFEKNCSDIYENTVGALFMLRILSKLIPFNPRQAWCVQYGPSLFLGKNKTRSGLTWSLWCARKQSVTYARTPPHTAHMFCTVHNIPSGKGTQPKIALSVHSSDLHLSYW